MPPSTSRGEMASTEEKVNKVLKTNMQKVTTTPRNGEQQPTQGSHQDQYKLQLRNGNPLVTLHQMSYWSATHKWLLKCYQSATEIAMPNQKGWHCNQINQNLGQTQNGLSSPTFQWKLQSKWWFQWEQQWTWSLPAMWHKVDLDTITSSDMCLKETRLHAQIY